MSKALAAAAEAFERTLEDLGFANDDLGDPAEVGRRAALLVSAETIWRHHLGTLLESEQVEELLRITPAEVGRLVTDNHLLGLPTKRGKRLFPGFQFGKARQAYPDVAPVLRILTSSVSSLYTIASWFASPQPLLRGLTPAAWLRKGGDTNKLLDAARRSSRRLGQ